MNNINNLVESPKGLIPTINTTYLVSFEVAINPNLTAKQVKMRLELLQPFLLTDGTEVKVTVKDMGKIYESDFTKVKGCRYVLYYGLIKKGSYAEAIKIGNRFGGRKYSTRQYAGGVAFDENGRNAIIEYLNNQ